MNWLRHFIFREPKQPERKYTCSRCGERYESDETPWETYRIRSMIFGITALAVICDPCFKKVMEGYYAR